MDSFYNGNNSQAQGWICSSCGSSEISSWSNCYFFPPKREKFQIQLISPGDTKRRSAVSPQPFPGKWQAVRWLYKGQFILYSVNQHLKGFEEHLPFAKYQALWETQRKTGPTDSQNLQSDLGDTWQTSEILRVQFQTKTHKVNIAIKLVTRIFFFWFPRAYKGYVYTIL